MEKEIAFLKAELARKDKIIAGLQQRLFGSSSEKIDPAQLQLEMDEILLGKPEPLPETSGETSAPEEEKPSAQKNRRTKAERFPKNLMILIEKEIIPDDLQADETPIDYLVPGHGSTREGRLWSYRDIASGTCYFDWHAGRGADCLLDFLGYDRETNTIAYQGGLHTDGYSVYDTVAAKHGLRHAGCLAHTRRKFTDLGKASPEVTVPILLYIQRIYHIEKQTRQTAAPPACRELIRRARSRPIAEELHSFVVEQRRRHLPGSDVAQALNYTLNQWQKILVCFGDGALELDTNLVENMIRPTKLGMKNWMFFGSLEAGTNNALIYTLLANCRAQGLDPEDYLIEVLKRLPHNATPEQSAALTPARIAAERKAKAEAVARAEAEQVA